MSGIPVNARSRWTRARNVTVSIVESTVLYEYDEDLTVSWRTARAIERDIVYLRLIIYPLATTSRFPVGSVKQIQNIYRLASRTG